MTKEVIATGKPKRDEGAMRYFPELPPEYAGGLEKEGAAALKDVRRGGRHARGALLLGRVRDRRARAAGAATRSPAPPSFAVAGSILRARRSPPGHPVTYGLPAEVAVFQDEPLAFETALPGPEMERRVLASYPAAAADVLLSGWIRGAEADRPQGRRGGAHLRQGQGRAARLPRPAPRADAGHVPVPVQRALLVDGEVAARAPGDVQAGPRPTPSASATRLM